MRFSDNFTTTIKWNVPLYSGLICTAIFHVTDFAFDGHHRLVTLATFRDITDRQLLPSLPDWVSLTQIASVDWCTRPPSLVETLCFLLSLVFNFFIRIFRLVELVLINELDTTGL